MPRNRIYRTLSLLACILFSDAALAHSRTEPGFATVTVHAVRHSYHNAVCVATAAKSQLNLPVPAVNLVLTAPGAPGLPCQVVAGDDRYYLTFIVPDLPQGAVKSYTLQHMSRNIAQDGVNISASRRAVAVRYGKELFTRYLMARGTNIPAFLSLLSDEGSHEHRETPQSTAWFANLVNGVEFAPVRKTLNKMVTLGVPAFGSGPVYGGFRALAEWRTPGNGVIATDTRDVMFYALPDGNRLVDIQIGLTPTAGALDIAEAEQGLFGIWVVDALNALHGGHIVNSAGEQGDAVTGKSATWVDTWGDIHGKPYGVAILPSPRNAVQAETWTATGDGRLGCSPIRRKPGQSPLIDSPITLRYRVYFHQGNSVTADVAGQYAAFADPPIIEVR